MTFRVGQKVVCVETWDGEGCGYGDEVGPISGQVYTVRAIGIGLNPDWPVLQVRLVEIVNLTRTYLPSLLCHEPAFRASRFRPIAARKTDISIFTKMLKPKRVKQTS